MTENDEKLWKEIESCLEYNDDIYYGDSVFLHTTSIENLMELFKNKETDLLKEFVEWYKQKMINDRIKISKEQEEYCDKIGEPIKAILWGHESKVLQRISYCLDDDLKRFLEERK